MKTYFNFRSTIGNTSWPQRGLAALAALVVAAVVGVTLIQALRLGAEVIPAAPAAQVAHTAVPNPNTPLIGTGSAYDGGSYRSPWPISGARLAHDGSAYVEYLLSGSSAELTKPAMPNPNEPASGGDSSYSGSAYPEYIEYLTGRPFSESSRPATPNPNTPLIGTGSAYDGGSYRSP